MGSFAPANVSKHAAQMRKKHAPAWLIDIRGRLINQGIEAAMKAVNIKLFQHWPVIDELMLRLVGAGLQGDSTRYTEAVKWWYAQAGDMNPSATRKGRLAGRLAAIDAISALTNQAGHLNAVASAVAAGNSAAAKKAVATMSAEEASRAAAADRAAKAKGAVPEKESSDGVS